MKKLLVLAALLCTGCVTDAIVHDADRLCDLSTQTKAEYRACMAGEYARLKQAAKTVTDAVKQ